MITLAIEASTYSGSAALVRGAVLLGARVVAMRGREREALMPAVAELLAAERVSAREIGRVVCGAGPGAFTSLRVAGSIAKGICLASGAVLIPISSLALIVASRGERGPGRFLAVSDAMRGESYAQVLTDDGVGGIVAGGPVRLVATSDVASHAREANCHVLGPQREGEELAVPRAASIVNIPSLIDATVPADLAAWEPGYGRLAEAQVKWEAVHGRVLGAM